MGTDVLTDFTKTSFTFDGKTRDVYRSGTGPAVLVIAEMPGITPKGGRVRQAGRGVGMLGCPCHICSATRVEIRIRTVRRAPCRTCSAAWFPACISHDFHAFATGKTSPVIDWLRALARSLHEECGGPGVGAVGMCFTGGFALAMIADAPVLAPVLSQPSLPFPVGAGRKRDLGLSDEDLEKVKQKCAARS